MNIAIIIAGGSGKRMGQDIPKQFLTVNNKPIIIYTLEAFQNHPDINAIIVSCLKGWEGILEAYAKQFNITKLVSIVEGGENGQQSTKNGLDEAKRLFSEDDMVIVHDANRPLVTQDIISDNIAKCKVYGNAITAIRCQEVIIKTEDNITSKELLNRDELKRTQTPHAFILKDILNAHAEAKEKGITNSVACCSLYMELGRKVYFSSGSERNMKLTTKEDIDIFSALLKIQKEEWMK